MSQGAPAEKRTNIPQMLGAGAALVAIVGGMAGWYAGIFHSSSPSWRVTVDETNPGTAADVAYADLGIPVGQLCSAAPNADDDLALVAVPVFITVSNTGDKAFSVTDVTTEIEPTGWNAGPSPFSELWDKWTGSAADLDPAVPFKLDPGASVVATLWQSWPVRSSVAAVIDDEADHTVGEVQSNEGDAPLAQQCGLRVLVGVVRSDGEVGEIDLDSPI